MVHPGVGEEAPYIVEAYSSGVLFSTGLSELDLIYLPRKAPRDTDNVSFHHLAQVLLDSVCNKVIASGSRAAKTAPKVGE